MPTCTMRRGSTSPSLSACQNTVPWAKRWPKLSSPVSICASTCSRPSGTPIRFFSALSNASVMLCSPPKAIRCESPVACSSISARLLSISPSAISNSPRSARSSAAGLAPLIGWRPSVSIRAAARMARGPSRAPARLVVPISSGTPATQKAALRSSARAPRKE